MKRKYKYLCFFFLVKSVKSRLRFIIPFNGYIFLSWFRENITVPKSWTGVFVLFISNKKGFLNNQSPHYCVMNVFKKSFRFSTKWFWCFICSGAVITPWIFYVKRMHSDACHLFKFGSRLPSPSPTKLLKASDILEENSNAGSTERTSLFRSCAPGIQPSAAS